MQLEKDTDKKEETINIYEELFSKKIVEEEPIEQIKEKEENITQNTSDIINEKKESIKINKFSFVDKLKEKTKKINMKYFISGLLAGIIVNVSFYHYQEIDLQNNSQKLATGLIYNLSEYNSLDQIARNIYLGMKENGWEPTVKLSNANVFVFQLDKGAEFTITKSQDLVSTKFHVEVSNFSTTMIKALMIQLEPTKIGGTKNFITGKRYDPRTNTVSFDIEKIGEGMLPIGESPFYLPNLPTVPKPMQLPSITLPPTVNSIPISPDLDKVLKEETSNNLNQTNVINENNSNIKNDIHKNKD